MNLLLVFLYSISSVLAWKRACAQPQAQVETGAETPLSISPPSAIKTINLHCWPLSLSNPIAIGRIVFDSRTTQSAISDYDLSPLWTELTAAAATAAAAVPDADELVRLGFFRESEWVGSLTCLSSLLRASGDGGWGTLFKVEFDPISKEPYQVSLEPGRKSETGFDEYENMQQQQQLGNSSSSSSSPAVVAPGLAKRHSPDTQLSVAKQGVAPTHNQPDIHNDRGEVMEAPPETMFST